MYFFCAMAMMLTITANVKAMDGQRWVCRIHLLQFNVEPPLKTSPENDRAYLSIHPASGIARRPERAISGSLAQAIVS